MPDQILVLVAEDEELVRLVIAEALRDAGLEVMEAEHAEAALSVLEHHAARVHVLFADIQMPGSMDGLALARHISENWPEIALLITSARPSRIGLCCPRKAAFWRSHTIIPTLFGIFASWRQPREGPEQAKFLTYYNCPGYAAGSY